MRPSAWAVARSLSIPGYAATAPVGHGGLRHRAHKVSHAHGWTRGFLYGPAGVGKTHVAPNLGHMACRRGLSVALAKTSRVLAELAGGRLDGSWESGLRKFARYDLLILDDFGLRDCTVPHADDFYELVSERIRGGSIILTSNRAPSDWYALFPNPVVAEGILDRLINSAHPILMDGKSYRPHQRPRRQSDGKQK